MTYYVQQSLEWLSRKLVEKIYTQTSPAHYAAGYNSIITLTDAWIQPGLTLFFGGVTPETLIVGTVNGFGFIPAAPLQQTHEIGDPVRAAAFPAGLPDNQLFSPAEVINYLVEAQNDFLLRTRCIYAEATAPIEANKRFYQQPDAAIRLEHVSIANLALHNVSQEDLDTLDWTWVTEETNAPPTHWYQDEINTGRYGYKPIPTAGGQAYLWFSERGPTTLTLTDTYLVPEAAVMYLNYRALGKCFAKDGEQRDPLRGEYCYRRYKFGLMLVTKFMLGMQVGLRDGVPAAVAFNPMAVPDASNPDSQPPPEQPEQDGAA